ncbi:MAG: flavoprotein [Elusimicrobiota bacterium]
MTARRRKCNVLLGVSGSIAAYKACVIVRELVKAGAQVRCLTTVNGAKFVSPLTLAALSHNPVCQDMFDPAHWEMAHLETASWADRVLIAPATADLMSRLAAGRAGGVIEAAVLSARGPVYVAPAMDTEMWRHPATQDNVKRLKKFGCTFLGPVRGELASGRTGMGRMLEPVEIVKRVLR